METAIRHDWTHQEVQSLYELPFNELMFRAQMVHRQNFDPNAVQISTLLSIKTGACPRIVSIVLRVPVIREMRWLRSN